MDIFSFSEKILRTLVNYIILSMTSQEFQTKFILHNGTLIAQLENLATNTQNLDQRLADMLGYLKEEGGRAAIRYSK
jgi:hypothetical protein